MAALRIHQHRVDQMRVALPLPPLPLGPTGQIGRVAPLQHHPFHRIGVLAGAGGRGICARGDQRVPAVEGDGGGEIDAGIVQPLHEGLQPFAPLGEGQFTQIVLVVAEQVIGAQMDRELLDQLG